MGWGAVLAGMLFGTVEEGPVEVETITGPQGTFLGPNYHGTVREWNNQAKRYAKIALEQIPRLVNLYSAPNKDQLDNVLKAFESVILLELKGGANSEQALKEWDYIRDYFAIGLDEVYWLFGRRVHESLTEYYSDYFLISVQKFVKKHPLLRSGTLYNRYELFESYRKSIGMAFLKDGDKETAMKIANMKTTYELFYFTGKRAVKDWGKRFLESNIPEDKWKPLLEKYKALRLGERIPTFDELRESWRIADTIVELLE